MTPLEALHLAIARLEHLDASKATLKALKEAAASYPNVERLLRIEAVVRDHRAQRADDRCIEDDDRLYAALGDGIRCDRRVGSKAEMLRNCKRFIETRCTGGSWRSYAELEAENLKLREELAKVKP